MPYKIEKKGNKFCVVKKEGTKTFGCHPTKKKAERQMAALYANEREK